jgi:hypothetical protein
MPSAPPSPDLSQLAVVGSIVREFALALFQRCSRLPSEGDPAGLNAWLEDECRHLNRLFLKQPGDGAETTSMAECWHTTKRLGHAIVKARHSPAAPENGVYDAFQGTALDIMTVVRNHDQSEVAEWGWMIQATSESLIANLFGYRDDQSEDYVPVVDNVPVSQDALFDFIGAFDEWSWT